VQAKGQCFLTSAWDFWIDSYFLMIHTGIPFKEGGLIDYDYLDYQIIKHISNAHMEYKDK